MYNQLLSLRKYHHTPWASHPWSRFAFLMCCMQVHQDHNVDLYNFIHDDNLFIDLTSKIICSQKGNYLEKKKKKHNRSQMTDRKIKEGEHLEKKIDGWRRRACIVLAIFPERWDRSAEWEQASFVPPPLESAGLIMESSHHLCSWMLPPLFSLFLFPFSGKTITATSEGRLSQMMWHLKNKPV